MWLSDDGKEEKREDDTAQGPNKDFLGLVSDAFFESREFFFVEFEVMDDVVDVLGVLTHIDPEAQGVHDDDDGHDKGYGEDR